MVGYGKIIRLPYATSALNRTVDDASQTGDEKGQRMKRDPLFGRDHTKKGSMLHNQSQEPANSTCTNLRAANREWVLQEKVFDVPVDDWGRMMRSLRIDRAAKSEKYNGCVRNRIPGSKQATGGGEWLLEEKPLDVIIHRGMTAASPRLLVRPSSC